MDRLLNTLLRTGALGVRFVFIFFLASQIDASSLGYYGLFTATIAYGLIFAGFEFFAFVTREIIGSEPEERGAMLKGHAAFSCTLYLALLPIGMAALYHANWPAHLYLWFVPILLLEHFNQEVFRLLVAMSEQVTASALLFIRQASWAIAIIAASTIFETKLTLDTIMAFWLIAGILTALLGCIKISRMEILGWHRSVDWTWVRRGALIAAPLLLATLSQRGIFTFDRYWLEALGGPEVLGAYVLFFGIASALTAFLDAAVFSFAYPALIKFQCNQEYSEARARVRQMLYQVTALCLAFAVVSWASLPILLNWIGNPVYSEFADLYPAVVGAVILFSLSQVAHWGLYSCGQDRAIVHGNLVAFATFLICTWISSESFEVYAVLFGINAAFLVMLVWKASTYIHVSRSEHP